MFSDLLMELRISANVAIVAEASVANSLMGMERYCL
mgnify:CR=1 FL=1